MYRLDQRTKKIAEKEESWRLSEKTQFTEGKFEAEDEHYLTHQLSDAEIMSFDNLDWWRLTQTIYPNLAKAARAIFCVLAKAAPVERVCS